MGDPSEPRRPLLGSAPRITVALVAAVAGAVLLVVGWWGVSGESLVALQLPYLASASIPGAALVIAAAVLLVGGRPPSATDARVEALFALLTEPAPADPTPDPTVEMPAASEDALVGVEGGTHYHRATCLLVAGKATHSVTAPGPTSALGPCPICLATP